MDVVDISMRITEPSLSGLVLSPGQLLSDKLIHNFADAHARVVCVALKDAGLVVRHRRQPQELESRS